MLALVVLAPLVLADQAQPLKGIVEITLGSEHSCGRKADGTVLCWGGSYGARPTVVKKFDKLVHIAAGSSHTCAQTATSIWCWGANNVYQLGVGDATNPKATVSGGERPKPQRTTRFGRPAAIATGDVSYAIDARGGVTCVGHSNFCGWETATSKVPGLPAIASVGVGGGHACAVSRAGEVYCWARTDWGQGGSGLDHTDQQPTKVDGLADVVEVVGGGAHTCARTKSKEVYCWGLNDHGQVGDGTTTQRNRPVKLALQNVEQIAIGGFRSCARLTGGTVQCWGASQDQPNIDFSKGGQSLVPTTVAVTDVVEIAVGGAHACARLEDTSLRCWGLNSDGQLGDGTTTYSAAPVFVVDR